MVFLTKAVDEARSKLEPTDKNYVSTLVYASRYSCEDIPKYRLPENEMPASIAKRLIEDELSTDGNPKLNLASYVTTYMEDEAIQLMSDNMSKNFIDFEEYPQTSEIHGRAVNIIANLFNAESNDGQNAIGTSTVGSSEGLMLATLAMKRKWQLRQQMAGKDSSKPNMIMSSAVQVCVEKACRYFEVEARFVDIKDGQFTLDVDKAVSLIDDNTIGIVAILGNTYTGHYDPVEQLDLKLQEFEKKNGYVVPIHVDGASGAFVLPFVNPDVKWDFRCKNVCSINTSGHKYGLVLAGVGWLVFRNKEQLPEDLIFNINYLGADQSSFTLNFSKSASNVIGQYYILIRNGRAGFQAIMNNLFGITSHLAKQLENSGHFKILSAVDGKGLPLVAFRLKVAKHWDEFDLARKLREHGWVVPAYTCAPKLTHMKMMRVVIREDFSFGRCEMLLKDIFHSIDVLDQLKSVEENKIEKKIISHWKNASGHMKQRTSTQVDGGSSVC